MANISAATSQKIKNMSIVCAILVVTIHVGWPNASVCQSTWWIDKLLTRGISNIAVPFFFVLSGYFLSCHFDEVEWWKKETRKRMRTLVIPFVFWSLVSLWAFNFFMLPISLMADYIAHRPYGTSLHWPEIDDWSKLFGFNLTDYPLLAPLWYVRCLFFFVIAAPLFKYVVVKFKWRWIIFAFALASVIEYLPMPEEFAARPLWHRFFCVGWSLSGMFYFSVGIFLQRFQIVFSSKLTAVLCGIYGCSMLAISVYIQSTGRVLPKGLGLVTIPTLMYAVWYVIPATKWPTWFTRCSFPIYLMHIVLLSFLTSFPNLIPLTNNRIGASYVGFFGSVVISILIVSFLKRLLPKFADFAFGNRA